MARKKQESESQSGSSWLTTFADLTTLLLTFFVLLLSMSVIDESRQRKALDSLVGAFGFMTGGRSSLGKPTGKDPREFTSPILQDQPVDVQMLKEITMRNNIDADVEIIEERDKILISIDGKVIFPEGSAKLNPNAQKYLSTLAGYLKPDRRDLEIRGHTDIHEILQKDQVKVDEQSWLLSSQRAQAVYDYFHAQGIPVERLSAHGFSYFRPRVDSQEQVHKARQNRRVDIVMGPNDTIPAHLLRARQKPSPYMNYKNFFFRFFPEKEGEAPKSPTSTVQGSQSQQ